MTLTRFLSSCSPALLAVLLAMTLAACSSRPVQQAQKAPAPASDPVPAPRPEVVTTIKGGGYYLDDGPHATLPDDLDVLPDAAPRIEPIYPPSLRPYTVMGQRFVPMTALHPYRERGNASWYGRKFHGRLTAIGEVYDMYKMTAAHPTLPLPSYVRVTNVSNGRSVIVRVNDRGPFLRGRLIDLSYAAAHRLDYINAGSAVVDVELLTPEIIAAMHRERRNEVPKVAAGAAAPEIKVTRAPTGHGGEAAAYLQVGAFETPANAARMMMRVREEFDLLVEQMHVLDEDGRYRLQIGPFDSIAEARSTAGRMVILLEVQPYLVMR